MAEVQLRPRPSASRHPGAADTHTAPPSLESLFATQTDDPLANAFGGRRNTHPFGGMSPVPDNRVSPIWEALHQTPRSRRAVAYVHIPFCENHCLFCGFYQNAWRREAGAPYVDAIIRQLKAFSQTPAVEGPPLQAVYMGGGTPTALSAKDLVRLIGALRQYLPLTPDCEITLEGRVLSFGTEKAKAAFDAGANRISLGVQCFNERVRKPLGRRANRHELIRVLEGLVALDRGAIVVDLIYGLPHQTVEDVVGDVRLCAELGLDGLDLYALNVLDSSPLRTAIDKGKMQPAARTALGGFFEAGEQAALAQGWRPISCNHWQGSLRERNVYNVAVKTGADCLAFGAGAGGFLGGYNYRITSDVDDFTARSGTGECLAAGMMRQNSMTPVNNAIKAGMELGLLDPRPVDKALATLAGHDEGAFLDHAEPLLAQWHKSGLLDPEHGFYRLTRPGRFWQVAMTGRLLAWTAQHPSLGSVDTHIAAMAGAD